jgi:hypothetical protein
MWLAGLWSPATDLRPGREPLPFNDDHFVKKITEDPCPTEAGHAPAENDGPVADILRS